MFGTRDSGTVAKQLSRMIFPKCIWHVQPHHSLHVQLCRTLGGIKGVPRRSMTVAAGSSLPRRGILSKPTAAEETHKGVQLSALIPQRLRHLDPIKDDIPLLVVLHGLLGSANNWRSLLGREDAFPGMFPCSVDLRNHGRSQHCPTMTYPEMCRDVLEFAETMGVKKASLIGHSMGGKVAMSLALRYPQRVSSLVVVDISPVEYEGTFMHQSVLDAMSGIDLSTVTSTGQAREMLTTAIPDAETREFVLTNLQLDSKTKQYKWKVNVESIRNGITDGDLTKFPAVPGAVYEGPVLFVRGEQSKYVLKRHTDRIKSFFPNAEIESLDTGHWPHAQAPDEFLDLLNEWYMRPELQGLEEDHALLQGL